MAEANNSTQQLLQQQQLADALKRVQALEAGREADRMRSQMEQMRGAFSTALEKERRGREVQALRAELQKRDLSLNLRDAKAAQDLQAAKADMQRQIDLMRAEQQKNEQPRGARNEQHYENSRSDATLAPALVIVVVAAVAH